MKNISKQVYKLATLLVLLLFVNCQKEDLSTNQNQEVVIKALYKHRKVSLEEIPKIKQEVIEKLNPEVFNRTEGSNSNQAIFDTENILGIIDTLNNANYSLQFRFPDTPISTFYNLVVGETPSGEVLTPYIMKYKCDDASLIDYIANGLDFSYFIGTVSMHKYTDFFALGEFDRTEILCPPELDEVGDPIPCDETTVSGSGSLGGFGSGSGSGNTGSGTGNIGGTGGGSFGCVYQGVYVVGCQGDNNDTLHPIGDCWNPNGSGVVEYDLWECYGEPVNPTSPNQGEGEDIGRTVNDDCPPCNTNDGGVPINTTSNLIDKDALTIINNCFAPDGLDNAQTLTVVDNSLETFIADYITANGCSTQTQQFLEYAIEAIEDGGVVNFSEAYIPIDSPDDNYVEIDEKSLIPNPLILDNGDQINIEFGITNDGVNANQEVRNHTIEGLKFALNEANNNLSSSDKITSIYIMATTNGAHSSTSNHSKATAIDISRINGVKMAVSGVTEQIIKLQEALDNYEYIRENFGPYFKHKYSIETDTWNYNHSIGGHKDHIHMATRTN